MSVLEKFLAGWTFRSRYPAYEAGDVIEVMVTSTVDDGAEARIGDSVLWIDGAPADALDTRVTVEVDSWDAEAHAGTATYLETVGGSSF